LKLRLYSHTFECSAAAAFVAVFVSRMRTLNR
jgi:hypothetical protein